MPEFRVPLPLTDAEKEAFDDLRARAVRAPNTRGSLMLSRMVLGDREVALIQTYRYDVAGKRVGTQPLAILMDDVFATEIATGWGDKPILVDPDALEDD